MACVALAGPRLHRGVVSFFLEHVGARVSLREREFKYNDP
jgi:hypothetical protein